MKVSTNRSDVSHWYLDQFCTNISFYVNTFQYFAAIGTELVKPSKHLRCSKAAIETLEKGVKYVQS